MSNFFSELKRRNVYRVAAAYAVIAWLLIQAASILFPTFGAPGWVMKVFITAVVLGFPVALLLAWAFELTPEGVKRTEEVPRGQSIARSTGRKLDFAIIGVLALAVSLLLFDRLRPKPHAHGSGIADKSIAVLPFENRSDDKANAYFADGIQDEILTRLAKIDDLKVISRTSTQRYKSSPENLPEIAKQLGVAHVLEGSVQKSGDQVRVTVQLINAATDAHLWAEVYDRKLTDIFAVESEVAQKIADSLQAKLSGTEQKELRAKPTQNLEAYDAYLRGKAAWEKLTHTLEDADAAITFFTRAVQLDPSFAQAWAYLSFMHTQMYASIDRTPQRRTQAKEAIDKAFEIDPDLGDAYFALGLYRYRGLTDYTGALEAFEKAQQRGVHRAMALDFSSYVKRRQGKWDEALKLQAEAEPLDPRNPNLLSQHAETYRSLRRFTEAHQLLDRALEVTPRHASLLAQKSDLYLAQGDLENAGRLLESIPLDPRDPAIFGVKLEYLVFAGRDAAAIEALESALRTPEIFPDVLVVAYRGVMGVVRLATGDTAAGRHDLEQAASAAEAVLSTGHQGLRLSADLAIIYGCLGDKAGVEREAERHKQTIANDAYDGPSYRTRIAAARAWLGENDVAIEMVTQLLATPGNNCITPALLRLHPMWHPLRGDPRFEKLCNQPNE